MLPAWATVVVALGSAVVGALTGLAASFVSSKSDERKLIHEESEAWRTLLIESCHGLSDAWLAFRWLLYEPSKGVSAFDDEASKRLGPLGTSCAQAVAKVVLVFGRGSPAGKAAAEVDGRISRLKDEAICARRPWDEAAASTIRSAIKDAEEAHEAFLDQAHDAIRAGSLAEARIITRR
jgi:hypothetical protein